ncbi:MAG: hypothetical protein JXA46_04990 [Dehalococcoidales bacterium]|nr:hypothetical protein [Dehalococcoidales bacterium]
MSVTDAIRLFFEKYEKAVVTQDFEKTVNYFADNFILAGPCGAIVMIRSEFLKLSHQAVQLYKNVGRTSAKILSMDETPITNEYSLVKTHWGLTFKKTGDQIIESDITVLLQTIDSEPKIMSFIDHQDEENMYQQLGLIST